MSIDSNEFRRVLGHYPTGVTVVATSDDDGATGMAIGSFASVSLDPPLVLFCPGKDSSTWGRMKQSSSFAVSVLGDDQKDVCGVFASKADDKFDGVANHTEVTGAPIIDGSVAWLDCEVHAIVDGGDHDIVLGRVVALGTDHETAPLLFFKGGYGHFEEI